MNHCFITRLQKLLSLCAVFFVLFLSDDDLAQANNTVQGNNERCCQAYDGLCGSRCCDGTLISKACREQNIFEAAQDKKNKSSKKEPSKNQNSKNKPTFPWQNDPDPGHSGKVDVVHPEPLYRRSFPILNKISLNGELLLDTQEKVRLAGIEIHSKNYDRETIFDRVMSWTTGKQLLVESMSDSADQVFVFIDTGLEQSDERLEQFKSSLSGQQLFPVIRDGKLYIFLNASLITQKMASPIPGLDHRYKDLFFRLKP